MGGIGSNRWIGHTRKSFVENRKHLSIKDVKAIIDPQLSVMQLELLRKDDCSHFQYVRVEADPIPHGRRYYFRCTCGKRCKALYWTGTLFACRTCCRLIHKSTNDEERRWFQKFLKEEGFTDISANQFIKSFRR